MIASLLHSMLTSLSKLPTVLSSSDMTIRAPIAVSLGAIPGALSRYYLTIWSVQVFGSGFPIGTFVINLTGALIMGFFITFTLERTITSPDLRLLFATGFLGSYTTFSTYTLDTLNLWQSGNYGRSLCYWLGSAALGMICVILGSLLARKLS